MSYKKRDLYLESLEEFFKVHKDYRNDFINIIKDNKYSLNFIEWTIINYCKQHEKNIYYEYKKTLKIYSKKMFDPISRNTHIDNVFLWNYSKNKSIFTTVKQLNFFRWFYINKVNEYMNENYELLREKYKNREN